MTDRALIAKLFADARKVRRGYKKWGKKISRQGFTARGVAFLGQLEADRDRGNLHIEPLERGRPSAYHPEIVTRVNSLQMLYAGGWIVSSKADFSLPLKMIADDPAFRERRKLEVE